MPSSYTSNLGIELPADGELDGTWGDVTNDNMNILDRAVNGVVTLSLSGTSSTLTTADGTLSNGQYKLLVLGGSPSGTHTIAVAPNDAQKIYFVRNTTAQSVVFTQGSGGDVTVAAGDSGIIYSNGGGSGAAVVNLTDDFAMSSVKITGGAITGITDLAIADGGTGASDAATARTNLGLGTIATQAASSVAITGGAITGITDLAIADGGTGASDAATARTNLGAQATVTGAATTIVATDLTASRALASDGSGKVAASPITATELGYLSGTTAAIQGQINDKGVPAGAVMHFAMSAAPTGWLKANGAAVSRTTYAALFAAVGTTFGVGDGSTTFNLPDMRGQFTRNWADNGGVDSGRAFGSTQTDAFQGHYHNVGSSSAAYVGVGGGGGTGGGNIRSLTTPIVYAQDAITDGTHGAPRVASETRPTNVALLACIKY